MTSGGVVFIPREQRSGSSGDRCTLPDNHYFDAESQKSEATDHPSTASGSGVEFGQQKSNDTDRRRRTIRIQRPPRPDELEPQKSVAPRTT